MIGLVAMNYLSLLTASSWLFTSVCNILYAMNAPNFPSDAANDRSTVVAMRLTGAPNTAGFPAPSQWSAAPACKFDADWQGQNANPQRSTAVQLLWTPETLFLRFTAQYLNITVFPDSGADGRRYQLWDRDVAEVFLQPDSSDLWRYKEFEVSPNGFWVDLDISHGTNENLRSGLRRRVHVDEKTKTWFAELAVPMKSITPHFDAQVSWRVNFFRVEGPVEPRFYSAWRPTNSPRPNFHVPQAFGILRFE